VARAGATGRDPPELPGDDDLLGRRPPVEFADQPFEYEGDTFAVTVSVGLATVEGEDVDVSQFIKIADDNLYKAKREGRNRVIG